jgi:hypothetical protein
MLVTRGNYFCDCLIKHLYTFYMDIFLAVTYITGYCFMIGVQHICSLIINS